MRARFGRVVKGYMASANLTALHDELATAKAVILPQIEGLEDFARLNLKPETLPQVQSATVDFKRRLDLINAGLAALDALTQDNYPEVPERDVVQTVYEDLRENVSTIEAAFAKFEAIPEASKAEITPGTPELKP